MSRAFVRISRKTALEIREFLTAFAYAARWIEEIDRAAKPKRSVLAHAKRVRAKKKTRKQETADIRAEVFERANEVCESLDCLVPSAAATELDHFFGRGKAPQTVRNCWALCRACHHRKTHNIPSATHWLENFAFHCEEHGYAAEAAIARSKIPMAELRTK